MSLADRIETHDSREKTVTVLNRESVDPIYSLLEKTVEADTVTVRERETDSDGPMDVVLVEDGEAAIGVSSMDAVQDTLLMVNSDLYVTGTVSLDEVETPEAVASLNDVTFDVADRQKFLLIHISRHIEALALETGGGELHVGFQELERINAERGTRSAYERLGDSDVETHVYGLPTDQALPDGLIVHDDEKEELANSWFVAHDGAGTDERKAALNAVETGPNEYTGYWTFDPDETDDSLTYLQRTYLDD
jgi:hypothetical protein